jgi:peptide/nickel transport system substrate-binding protein
MAVSKQGVPARKCAPLFLGLFALLLVACSQEPAEVTRLVEVTQLIPVTTTAQTGSAPVTRLVVVTATPAPEGTRAFQSEEPTHYRTLVAQEPQTLDPALAWDPASRHLVQNVVEPLLLPDPEQPDRLLPLLATGWEVSENGLAYTFTIRRRVSFSNGNALTAEDVAYSLQRGLLQSAPGSPFGALLDPLLGYTSRDITEEIEDGAYAGDRDALLANAAPQDLRAVCERVQEAIVADDAEGTVTVTLVRRWAPLPAALSQPWAGIVDQAWAAEQGAWDGSCQTWAAWYAPVDGESALSTRILGTGPYLLDHWTPENEYVLIGNDDYWRRPSAPLGQSGPIGAPAIESVTVRREDEAGLRWQALRDGQAESVDLVPELESLARELVGEVCTWPSQQCMPTVAAEAPLRRYAELPLASHHGLFFNFNIRSETNSFIGSGQLDGNGIPPDFFGDEHVRRALDFCFDGERFVELALDGDGRPAQGLLPIYYDNAGNDLPRSPTADLQACAEELAVAWETLLPATGFRFQIPFESGNERQQTAALLLQEGLNGVNPNYKVEIVGLSATDYQQALRERTLPLLFLDWSALFPDPHSWVAPAFANDVLAFQQLPADLEARFAALLQGAVSALDPEARLAIYQALDEQRREFLPHILLPEATGNHYQQRWVSGWFYHPLWSEPYYYALDLEGN